MSGGIHQGAAGQQREYRYGRIGMLLLFLSSGKQHNMISVIPAFSGVVSAYELISIEIRTWV